MKKLLFLVVLACFSLVMISCEETEEGVDKNNDIIIRNLSESDLWIRIDGNTRGRIENDGIARTMWDDISDGFHRLEAFEESDYINLHCMVDTDFLEDGEDFYWYLEDDDEYSGTFDGDC